MRIRTIKPEFWTSQDVADLPDDFTRLLFIGLWNYADDEGRGRDDPRLIKAALFPLRDSMAAHAINDSMWTLAEAGLIVRYTVERPLYAVVKWPDHQRVNRPTASKYGGPHEGSHRSRADVMEDSSAVDNGELEDSLPEGNREQGREGNREQGDAALRAVPDNRPDADQKYLAEKLSDAWDLDLDFPALQKLNNKYGRAAITNAMRELHGFPPSEAVRSLYAYIESIAKESVSA